MLTSVGCLYRSFFIEQVCFLRVIFLPFGDFRNLQIFINLYKYEKLQSIEANILQDFGFAAYFGNFRCGKTFQSIQSFRSYLKQKKIFYPLKLSKVAAQDYFSSEVATRLLINHGIRKHQKLQRPANTNWLHWKRELKWAAENAKIAHHNDNFEFLFQYDCSSLQLALC